MNDLPKKFLNEITSTAVNAAKLAGDIIIKNFKFEKKVDFEEQHDIKLEIDGICEQKIIKMINEKFPSHSILSEESGFIGRNSEFTWIIDPLDGTVNYYSGIPFACVCISCYRNFDYNGNNMGSPVLGIIYNPFSKELYSAEKGKFAHLNCKTINTRNSDKLDKSIISFSFGSSEKLIDRMSIIAVDLAKNARKIRNFGSSGIELAMLASGKIDGYIQKENKIWDFAAGKIIVEEAGGVFFAEYAEGVKWNVLACSKNIFNELFKIIYQDNIVN